MTTLHWLIISLLIPALALLSAGHALLYKRDPRAALGWVAFCLFFPLAGPIAYTLFGINRVFTRARKLEEQNPFRLQADRAGGQNGAPAAEISARPVGVAPATPVEEIFRVSEKVSRRPLLGGNQVVALLGGEEAYPAMLKAIVAARERIYLATYIFDTDATGRTFIEALAAANRRGVDVRVLLDGFGELYSWRRAGTILRRAGIRVERFLPPRLLPPTLHFNLRNHRKILVVDGVIGYTGGMNLGDRHLVANLENRRRVNDIHFRLQGPVAAQMEEVFLEDWGFCTGRPEEPPPSMAKPAGSSFCRVVVDGPNEDLGKLEFILLGAIAGARRSIDIMTPYFLPDREMISALQVAALRGVEVTIILPARNNLPYMHWATRHLLPELLEHGVRIYYQPPPFAHSKLFVIDRGYTLIGSANLDPRSLRLNFEIGVEVADREFCRNLCEIITTTRGNSHQLAMAELEGRSLPARLRDAAVWLFSPYL
jgi:cardiolipin synthase